MEFDFKMESVNIAKNGDFIRNFIIKNEVVISAIAAKNIFAIKSDRKCNRYCSIIRMITFTCIKPQK